MTEYVKFEVFNNYANLNVETKNIIKLFVF